MLTKILNKQKQILFSLYIVQSLLNTPYMAASFDAVAANFDNHSTSAKLFFYTSSFCVKWLTFS